MKPANACAENLGNGAIAKWRFLVRDSRSAGRFYVACGVKLQGLATGRQVIWSLCFDPLLGRDEVTRTNRGRRRHKRSRTFLLIFPSRMPGKIFRKNSDSPLSVLAILCTQAVTWNRYFDRTVYMQPSPPFSNMKSYRFIQYHIISRHWFLGKVYILFSFCSLFDCILV